MHKDLPIDILSAVEKPARYTGMEFGSIVKPESEVEVSFALAFPDTYEIGMSYLGFKILYAILNKQPYIQAERVFAPWVDMEDKMRERGIALESLETSRRLDDFDLVGFTLLYEMSYSNILNMMDLGGVPIWTKDRGLDDPFVCAGGPCVFNSERWLISWIFACLATGNASLWKSPMPTGSGNWKENQGDGRNSCAVWLGSRAYMYRVSTP